MCFEGLFDGSPFFDPASFGPGLVLGLLSGFFVAGVAAALIRLVAHWIAGSDGPRVGLGRCLLLVGVVAIDLGAGRASRSPDDFLIGWIVGASATALIHLLALGLTLGDRRPRGAARLARWAARLGCAILAFCLIGLAADGGAALSLAILTALMVDVACLKSRRGGSRPPANGRAL